MLFVLCVCGLLKIKDRIQYQRRERGWNTIKANWVTNE